MWIYCRCKRHSQSSKCVWGGDMMSDDSVKASVCRTFFWSSQGESFWVRQINHFSWGSVCFSVSSSARMSFVLQNNSVRTNPSRAFQLQSLTGCRFLCCSIFYNVLYTLNIHPSIFYRFILDQVMGGAAVETEKPRLPSPKTLPIALPGRAPKVFPCIFILSLCILSGYWPVWGSGYSQNLFLGF